MDVCGAEQGHRKNTAEETTRQPLAPSEKNNAISQRPRTREATARYKIATSSPSLSTHVVHKRCQSPNVTRTIATSSPSISKRAQSAERSRPSTPSSLLRPSTPDSSAEMQISSRRLMGSRTLEGLWPSTMRSLCVSFQSDAFSLPISKREKPVAHNSSEHTLKSSANVAHKQAATLAAQRKATPERKRTPLRGHKASDQSENSRPLNNSHARVVDQQRWANRTGGKVSASALTRSMDVTDRGGKAASLPFPGRGILPLRRTPISDGLCRPLQKSVSEVANQVVYDKIGRMGFETYLVGDASLRLSGIHRLCSSNVGISSSLSERALSITHSSRSQSLPITGSPRPPSPSRASLRSSSPSRGMPSPSRTRPSNPFPSLSSNSFSVLSFIGDVRRGKKGVNLIEDAQQLRLLYNRYLQWRFTNAQADAALSIQKVIAEEILFNVWNTILELRDSVTMKRINLRQMRQEMKINLILKDQMAYLDDWALLEREHLSSLSGAIEALEASTLRLPVAGGTRADIHTMKDAICSAVDVMQATGSSICSLLSRVEGINYLVSELADVAAQERTVLDECGDLLVSTVAMQIEENSLRTHLIQLKQALCNGAQPISALRTLV